MVLIPRVNLVLKYYDLHPYQTLGRTTMDSDLSSLQVVSTIAIITGYLLLAETVRRGLKVIGERKNAAPKRAVYVAKVFNIGLIFVVLIVLSVVWGVDYRGIIVFTSSVMAILGVAFFAQWSLLSNITASIVIFFNYHTHIGDRIRVVDGENTLEGTILDINLFQVLIEDTEGNLINYPNNLIIQKPLIKLSSQPPIRAVETQSSAKPSR